MLQTTPKIPEFLQKLKKLVDSPSTDRLIRWNQDGKSFLITDGHTLAKDYFPLLFKHKNVFSFIRQLNMYGFHKLNRIEFGINRNNFDESEWSHQHFVRDRYDLLKKIQRKVAPNTEMALSAIGSNNEDSFHYEVRILKTAYQQLRQRDQTRSSKISELERRNALMRNELHTFRHQIDKQSKWINELTTSLTSFMSNPELMKKTLFYNKSLKRSMLPLIGGNYRVSEPCEDVEIDVCREQLHPDPIYGKVHKLEPQLRPFVISPSPDSYIDYEIDELLNDSEL